MQNAHDMTPSSIVHPDSRQPAWKWLLTLLALWGLLALAGCHGTEHGDGHADGDGDEHGGEEHDEMAGHDDDGGSEPYDAPFDAPGFESERPNTLTDAERDAGWALLFDGRTTAGWRGFKSDTMPDGWAIEDGTIARADGGGDIISEGQYDDFELRLQWKIAPAGNSGIFFHVTEDTNAVYMTGPEMQVLDNVGHPNGKDPKTSAASNYALHAPTKDMTRPVGEWNQVFLRVHEDRVEHWLNGERVVHYTLGSPEWEALVADTKFADWPGYGRRGKGHIALQDHSDPVWYRDIKVRRLE